MIDHALKLRFCPVRYAVFQVLLQSAFQSFYINLEERLNRLGQRSGTAVKSGDDAPVRDADITVNLTERRNVINMLTEKDEAFFCSTSVQPAYAAQKSSIAKTVSSVCSMPTSPSR